MKNSFLLQLHQSHFFIKQVTHFSFKQATIKLFAEAELEIS